MSNINHSFESKHVLVPFQSTLPYVDQLVNRWH